MADYSKLNEAAAAETKTGFTAQPYQPGAPVSNQVDIFTWLLYFFFKNGVSL